MNEASPSACNDQVEITDGHGVSTERVIGIESLGDAHGGIRTQFLPQKLRAEALRMKFRADASGMTEARLTLVFVRHCQSPQGVMLFREFVGALRDENENLPKLAAWTDKELAKIWRSVDAGGTGSLPISTFLAFLYPRGGASAAVMGMIVSEGGKGGGGVEEAVERQGPPHAPTNADYRERGQSSSSRRPSPAPVSIIPDSIPTQAQNPLPDSPGRSHQNTSSHQSLNQQQESPRAPNLLHHNSLSVTLTPGEPTPRNRSGSSTKIGRGPSKASLSPPKPKANTSPFKNLLPQGKVKHDIQQHHNTNPTPTGEEEASTLRDEMRLLQVYQMQICTLCACREVMRDVYVYSKH